MCCNQKSLCFLEFDDNSDKTELTFVHWYEILNDKMLSLDEIDQGLAFIELGLQQTMIQVDQLPIAPEYGLLPVAAIRSLAHLVNKNYVADVLNFFFHSRLFCSKLIFLIN